MKSLEEIQDMSLEALLDIADDESVKVPSDLEKNIETVCAAMQIESSAKAEARHRRLRIPIGAVASIGTAAAAAAIVLSVNPAPKDTFDDPMLAYAALEKSLSLIGQKASSGLSMASSSMDKVSETTGASNMIDFK